MLEFIVLFISGDVFSYEVTPLSAEVHVLEGRHDTATLFCNYSGTNILAFQWYKQYPNSATEGFSQAFENSGHHDMNGEL